MEGRARAPKSNRMPRAASRAIPQRRSRPRAGRRAACQRWTRRRRCRTVDVATRTVRSADEADRQPERSRQNVARSPPPTADGSRPNRNAATRGPLGRRQPPAGPVLGPSARRDLAEVAAIGCDRVELGVALGVREHREHQPGSVRREVGPVSVVRADIGGQRDRCDGAGFDVDEEQVAFLAAECDRRAVGRPGDLPAGMALDLALFHELALVGPIGVHQNNRRRLIGRRICTGPALLADERDHGSIRGVQRTTVAPAALPGRSDRVVVRALREAFEREIVDPERVDAVDIRLCLGAHLAKQGGTVRSPVEAPKVMGRPLRVEPSEIGSVGREDPGTSVLPRGPRVDQETMPSGDHAGPSPSDSSGADSGC